MAAAHLTAQQAINLLLQPTSRYLTRPERSAVARIIQQAQEAQATPAAAPLEATIAQMDAREQAMADRLQYLSEAVDWEQRWMDGITAKLAAAVKPKDGPCLWSAAVFLGVGALAGAAVCKMLR